MFTCKLFVTIITLENIHKINNYIKYIVQLYHYLTLTVSSQQDCVYQYSSKVNTQTILNTVILLHIFKKKKSCYSLDETNQGEKKLHKTSGV